MQPKHADDLVRMELFGVLQTAERAVDFVLGMLPDAARVEQNRIGVGRPGHDLIARLRRLATTSSLSSMFIWQPTVSMYKRLAMPRQATWSGRKTLPPGSHAAHSASDGQDGVGDPDGKSGLLLGCQGCW